MDVERLLARADEEGNHGSLVESMRCQHLCCEYLRLTNLRSTGVVFGGVVDEAI